MSSRAPARRRKVSNVTSHQPDERSYRSKRIAELNDRLRTKFDGGSAYFTAGVQAEPLKRRLEILEAVRTYEFHGIDGNNPYGENDFGAVEVAGEKYFFKIDYYAADESGMGSEDPADPNRTKRVMTIMRADEY